MIINRKKVVKSLIIISIIIIILGIILGINISNEIINNSNADNIYVDGTNFSGVAKLSVFFVSKILGIVVVLYSLLIDVVIWVIYAIIIGILKIIGKIKKKKVE